MQKTLVALDQGAIGQVQGPFSRGEMFTFSNKSIKVGIFINEKDLMTFDWEFPIRINGIDVIVYKPGMYEPNVSLPISSISFPQGAPASVFIDYVVLEI